MTGRVEGSGVRGVVVGAGGADPREETEEVKTEGRVSLHFFFFSPPAKVVGFWTHLRSANLSRNV